MRHISIAVPERHFSIVNIAGAFQMLKWANDTYRQETGKLLFQVELVGISSSSLSLEGVYKISVNKNIYEIRNTDLIIIPSVHGFIDEALKQNKKLIDWIAQQYSTGTEIASSCVGTFLLAESGILNGKPCSTHWIEAQRLQKMYPKIQVQSEKIIVDFNGIYTSGGAFAFTNLIIYLIEKYESRELAIKTAKAFMINMDMMYQNIFLIFHGQKQHGDQLVLDVQTEIEKSYNTKINVETLTRLFHTNRRTLERRFKVATGNTIIEYLQRVRIEAAKKVLEKKDSNVNDAIFSSGYNDPKSFRDLFKKIIGITPLEYKKKFT